MSILITGGAGFIGSFTAKRFCEAGREPVVLDNLSNGRIDRTRWGRFYHGDVRDVPAVRALIRAHHVSAVVHLAASAQVGESLDHPAPYYSNNVAGTLALLEAMHAEDVRSIVFASSCSVYGDAASLRLSEMEEARPMSPYGESKLIAERALSWYARAYSLRSISLRYFNVAGGQADCNLGEDFEKSLRILPQAIQAACNEQGGFHIFGTDFDTVDGTAVRDYIHVRDVADANLRAIEYLEADRPSTIANVGTGNGVSVRQIVDEVGRLLGRPVPVRECPRRPGDVPCAVADPSRASSLLNWRPVRSSLSEIVESALAQSPVVVRRGLPLPNVEPISSRGPFPPSDRPGIPCVLCYGR